MSEERQISLFAGEAPPELQPCARAGSSPESALPISEVNAIAREVLEGAFQPLWVVGEVANWRRVSSGHCYFSLRDDSAQLSCVMWRSDAARLPTDPEEGMEVCAHGQITLYEARGSYQMQVRRLEARGEGLWKLAFERLRKKLAEEGLLAPERKRPLPRFPRRVGVVTSRTGAALRDVVSVIRRRAPWTEILVSDCRVQGEGAAAQIVDAVSRLVEFGGCDVLVLTRGGGSVEDLWAFNEEAVARAIASCPVPTVSAVGHEIDVSIADLVADKRAPTPSAAGELVVPDRRALAARLRTLAGGLVKGLQGVARRGGERVRRAAERWMSALLRRLERGEARRDRLAGRLDALSPVGTLRRGYAVPLDPSGRILRRVSEFEIGGRFELRVVDGKVRCETLELREEELPEAPAVEERRGGSGA